MQLAHLTLLRLDLLEVAVDDTLEKKLILALLFKDTLVLHTVVTQLLCVTGDFYCAQMLQQCYASKTPRLLCSLFPVP